jgi:hypothetical protein
VVKSRENPVLRRPIIQQSCAIPYRNRNSVMMRTAVPAFELARSHWYPPTSRLKAEDTTTRSWNPDRAATVAPMRHWHDSACYYGGCATG